MRLMAFDESGKGPPEILVTILDVDYSDEVSRLDQAMNRLNVDEPFECGIHIDGSIHDTEEQGFLCANTESDDRTQERYCKAERLHSLLQVRLNYRWLPSMLAYYWQNGIDRQGVDFLESVGFVYLYR